MTEESLMLHQLLESGSTAPSKASWIGGAFARIRSSWFALGQIYYTGISNLGRRISEWAERRVDRRNFLTQVEEEYSRLGHHRARRGDRHDE